MVIEKKDSIKIKWVQSKAHFLADELKIRDFQVMQRWEKNYMKALASVACLRGGHILEVGFGLGIAASYIQKIGREKKIKSHTIIECHPDVIIQATKMFSRQIGKGKVTLINGFWEDVVPKLKEEIFTGILFDTSPLDRETQFFHFFPFFKEAYRLLKKGGVFTYFSDEPKEISKRHRNQLFRAGFRKINYRICNVKPPQDCRYWKEKTIVVPIVLK